MRFLLELRIRIRITRRCEAEPRPGYAYEGNPSYPLPTNADSNKFISLRCTVCVHKEKNQLSDSNIWHLYALLGGFSETWADINKFIIEKKEKNG